jgi:hypothetical protein
VLVARGAGLDNLQHHGLRRMQTKNHTAALNNLCDELRRLYVIGFGLPIESFLKLVEPS